MADSRRAARVGATVHSALGEVLRSELKDPRLHQAGLITITGVEVSADLSVATVYVTATNDEPDTVQQMMAGFASAAAYLRSALAKRVALKRIPELRFRIDPAIRHGRRIDAILQEMDTDP
ncbi:MAG: 30S ribosome-binding factor RbfA [bacterium]